MPPQVKWLLLLATSILAAVFGVIVPNRYKQTKSPRAHNGIKLFGECLARHQLAYLTYFLTLGLAADFDLELVRYLIIVGVLLSLLFYTEAVYSVTHQEDRLNRFHQCRDITCDEPLTVGVRWTMCGRSFVLAVILLATGIAAATMVSARPSPGKSTADSAVRQPMTPSGPPAGEASSTTLPK